MRQFVPFATTWGHGWRSSRYFITLAVSVTLLIDTLLHEYLVSILPFILEHRLDLHRSLTQRVSLALLAESALVSFFLSPLVGQNAERLSKGGFLVVALALELVGAMVIASAKSLSILFSGRLIQAVANTCVGVLGLANLAQKTSPDELGKLYGIITISTAIGTSCGPLIAGALFKLAGYWTAWSCAFIASVVAIILQALMVEPTHGDDVTDKPIARPEPDCDEESPLLPEQKTGCAYPEKVGVQFYTCLFSNRRYVGGIVSTLCYAIVSASFDTTLPLHVRDTFHWGSLPVGFLFAAIQGPNVFLSVPVGWLKRRMGTRHPTSAGFAALAVLLWLTGIPGDSQFSWANRHNRGPVLYVLAVMGSGLTISLLNGVGMVESTHAVSEIELERPGIFGPRGGHGRAVLISRMSWTLGSFLGPILSGFLTERVGYYEMSCTLAGICGCGLLVALWTLKSSVPPTTRPRGKSLVRRRGGLRGVVST